ncbi:MAG TPA: hypothetical protein PKD20_01945 [Candidatus Saccharibacteria bacterium]|jgi:calcineurin-like phosphoesterase family protein|nr:hypothetical protein [Candidatus Saccharibacteria bacterium]HMT55621.1 hypothetical protein [Candidatus Saccharibacteria bacterium]
MQNLEETFFTSDNHFGHKVSVARPVSRAWGTNTRHQFQSVDDMNQGMIDAWNLMVPENGTIYVQGDFVYNGNHAENADWVIRTLSSTLQKLHGTKHLIVGNHDLPYTDESMTKVYEACGFESVTHGTKTIELAGKLIDMCHFPRWRGNEARPEHYPESITLDEWEQARWLLHGHKHSQVQLDLPNKMIDIGVDAWSFRPVPARTILHMITASETLMDTIHQAGRTAPNSYTA